MGKGSKCFKGAAINDKGDIFIGHPSTRGNRNAVSAWQAKEEKELGIGWSIGDKTLSSWGHYYYNSGEWSIRERLRPGCQERWDVQRDSPSGERFPRKREAIHLQPHASSLCPASVSGLVRSMQLLSTLVERG